MCGSFPCRRLPKAGVCASQRIAGGHSQRFPDCRFFLPCETHLGIVPAPSLNSLGNVGKAHGQESIDRGYHRPLCRSEPQRGEITQPRLTAWVNGTQTDTRALKGRNNQSPTYRSSRAIPEWGNTYFALSGLATEFGGNLSPGLQSAIVIGGPSPGLRYCAPLGLSHNGAA